MWFITMPRSTAIRGMEKIVFPPASKLQVSIS